MKNERGTVIVLAVGTMVILFSLGVSFMMSAQRHTRIAKNQLSALMAHYTAQAGAEDAIRELLANGSWRTGFTNKNYVTIGSTMGSYTVSLSDVGGNIEITSTGGWGTASDRIITAVQVTTSGASITEFMRGGGKIEIKDSSGTIDGNLKSNGQIDIQNSSATINGTQTQNSSDSVNLVNTSNSTYQLSTYSAIANTTINGNYTFSSGTYNGVYYIKGDAIIDGTDITVNGSIIAEGKIEVKDNSDRLTVTASESNPALFAVDEILIDTSNSARITGFLYSAGADIQIKKSSSATITGNMIAKDKVQLDDVDNSTVTGLLHSWDDKVEIKKSDNLTLLGALTAKDDVKIDNNTNLNIDWNSSLQSSPPSGFSSGSSAVLSRVSWR
jgi:Tfp pilus assembly protein PilX